MTGVPNFPVNIRHFIKWRLGFATAITHTSPAERAMLRKYATGKRCVAEVGVFEGVNTRMFREVIAEDGTVIAIDPYWRRCFGLLGFGWIRRVAHAEVSRCTRGRVIWVERCGHEGPDDPRVTALLPVDMVFIDGDHSYEGIHRDWERWRTLLAIGGIVALHDSVNCTARNVGSERFTQAVIKRDPSYEFVESVDTLTIMRRIA